MTLIFNTNWVFHDACLVQIWLFQLKSVTGYRADKVKFTDGRTHRRRQRQYPFGLKVQGGNKKLQNNQPPSCWRSQNYEKWLWKKISVPLKYWPLDLFPPVWFGSPKRSSRIFFKKWISGDNDLCIKFQESHHSDHERHYWNKALELVGACPSPMEKFTIILLCQGPPILALDTH